MHINNAYQCTFRAHIIIYRRILHRNVNVILFTCSSSSGAGEGSAAAPALLEGVPLRPHPPPAGGDSDRRRVPYLQDPDDGPAG